MSGQVVGIAAVLVRAARARQQITRAQLSLRADVDQALVARVESGAHEPDAELLERLLLVMGEEPVRVVGEVVGSRRLVGDWDPRQMAEELRKTPSERLRDAFAWNTMADQIYLAFKRERAAESAHADRDS
jgi:transcriptional regulator with XRE-family HTH domain